MTDIESLIEKTLPFIKTLLKTYGEFFPVASGIKADGSFVMLKPYEESENPPSDKLVMDFKKAFIKDAGEYRAITIFYDVLVTKHRTGLKTDALAICAEAKEAGLSHTYFYPYKITNEIIFDTEIWAEEKDREIFTSQT
jgi:hypothetical protein